MRSSVSSRMPPRIARSLRELGLHLATARRKRRLTAAMVADRVGVSASTYHRMEKGDPKVALGAYAMALFVLGFGDVFAHVADPGSDTQGLLLDDEHLPQRVRPKKDPTPL